MWASTSGRGVLGLAIPGCAQTFEEPQSQSRQQRRDRYQKLRRIKEGDIVAIPAGIPYWTYNNGDSPLVAITLLDTTNSENQLDRNPRRFYLAGNPKEEHPETQEGRKQGNPQQEEGNNLFSGFETRLLAQALNVDEETARKLKSRNDRRNQIVRVSGGLSIISQQEQQEEEEGQEEEEMEQQQERQGGGRIQGRGREEEEEEEEEKGQGQRGKGQRQRGQRHRQEEEEEEEEQRQRGQGQRRRQGQREQGQPEEEEEEGQEQRGQGQRRRRGQRRPRQEEEEQEEEEQQRGQGQRQHGGERRPSQQEEEQEQQGQRGQGQRRRQGQRREEEEEEEQQRQPKEGQRRQGQGSGNALEETICSIRIHHNIGNPSHADFYNPRAGRISTVNSLDLPILKWLRLSAERVVLYRNGMYAPHWNINANSIVYVTRGRGRVQVVDCRGNSVFNGELRRGQLLVVPQNFAVAEQAGSEGFEYIVFKTNGMAMVSQMVGRTSFASATPAEVLANAFQLRPQQVSALKYARDEGPLVSPASQSQESFIVKV